MDTKIPTLGKALAAGTLGEPTLQPQPPAAPKPDTLAVGIGDIPLPPAHLVDELDNSDVLTAASANAEVAGAEIATLDFVGDEPPEVVFTLKYPFRWEGVRHDAITVRQLRTGQLGDVFARLAREKRQPELYDFYGAMCGLPPSVLRALPAVDGEPIIDKAWDFLPPSVRPAQG